MSKHVDDLKRLGACADAFQWAAQYPTAQAAWDACKRGDWMLWLLGKLCGKWGSANHRQVVGLACRCARLSEKHWTDKRSRDAVALAERFAAGELVPLDELRAAAAYAAAYAAAAYAAYAAYAAAAAAAYAAAYAAAAARKATLKRCADIVREVVPKAPSIP